MEEKNKKNLLIGILLVIIVALVIVLVVVMNKKEEPTPKDNSEKITEEVKKELFDNLLTPSEEYGLYFGKSVTIETVDDDDLLSFAFEKYVFDKKIDLNAEANCVIDEEFDCSESGDDLITVSKKDIDEYIKKEFNTQRVFTPKNSYDPDGSLSHIMIGTINGHGTGRYFYDSKKETYYLGLMASSGSGQSYNHKLVKTEVEDDKVYIYDKFLYCLEDELSGYYPICGPKPEEYEVDTALLAIGLDDSGEIIDEAKYKNKELVEDNDGVLRVNYDYIFKQYDSQLDTYKHTFKIVDGNYYWVSSEVVK